MEAIVRLQISKTCFQIWSNGIFIAPTRIKRILFVNSFTFTAVNVSSKLLKNCYSEFHTLVSLNILQFLDPFTMISLFLLFKLCQPNRLMFWEIVQLEVLFVSLDFTFFKNYQIRFVITTQLSNHKAFFVKIKILIFLWHFRS